MNLSVPCSTFCLKVGCWDLHHAESLLLFLQGVLLTNYKPCTVLYHNMNRYIGVKAHFTGLHCWPSAPTGGKIGFLQNSHRHVFNLELVFSVTHEDRQLEFFETELYVNSLVKALYGKEDIKDLGSRSCEAVALEIHDQMGEKYQDAIQTIKVQEDDENYALLDFADMRRERE